MKRHTLPLFRVMGISIALDYSWFVIFGLITWMLAANHYPAEFKDWPPLLYWFMGATTALMLFVSVLLHELGHSFVALRYGIPVRSITLFLFGGVAQLEGEPPKPGAEFSIAIAGPLVSLALAVAFSLVQPFIVGAEPLLGLAKYLAYINFALVLFNLIPGYPLDGAACSERSSGPSTETCGEPRSSQRTSVVSSPSRSSFWASGRCLPATSVEASGSRSSAGSSTTQRPARCSKRSFVAFWPVTRSRRP